MVQNIEKIEIDLLLEGIFQCYGYDFRSYARASVERRIRQCLLKTGCTKISEMIPRLLYEREFFQEMVKEFSITVTEMFRDPEVYLAIRKEIIPRLASFPNIRIWHAGCATGEEVYSMAILLKEEGLLERTTIFATDFNDSALETARNGIYPLDQIRQYTKNYQMAGGQESFSGYYRADQGSIILDRGLAAKITFANHNLVTDGVFSENHFIICRNVMIYFNHELQDRVLRLFSGSLARNGFLCLGSKESLLFSSAGKDFAPVDERLRLFQKKGCTE